MFDARTERLEGITGQVTADLIHRIEFLRVIRRRRVRLAPWRAMIENVFCPADPADFGPSQFGRFVCGPGDVSSDAPVDI